MVAPLQKVESVRVNPLSITPPTLAPACTCHSTMIQSRAVSFLFHVLLADNNTKAALVKNAVQLTREQTEHMAKSRALTAALKQVWNC